MRRKRRLIIGGIVAAAVALSAVPSAWSADENQTITAAITPTRLSSTVFTPVAVKFTLDITGTGFGAGKSHSLPSPLEFSQVKLPKDSLINAKGIPVCTEAKLRDTTADAARKACPGSILGTGQALAKFEFPDDPGPTDAPAPVTAFNGPIQGGNPVFIIHAYTTQPAPTTFVVPGVWAKVGGGFGRGATFNVPPIASGYGSLIHFDLTTGKKMFGPKPKKGKKSKKHSYGSARCKTGKLVAQALFHYQSGVEHNVDTTVNCTPIKTKKKKK